MKLKIEVEIDGKDGSALDSSHRCVVDGEEVEYLVLVVPRVKVEQSFYNETEGRFEVYARKPSALFTGSSAAISIVTSESGTPEIRLGASS